MSVCPPDVIERLEFHMTGNEENFMISNVEVKYKDLFSYMLPIPNGIYDAHMGTTEPNWKCLSCFNTKQACPGHFGHLVLKYPVQNHSYREDVLLWLKAICIKCGNLLTNNSAKLLTSIKQDKKLSTYVKLIRLFRKNIKCESCDEIQPYFVRDKNRSVSIWAEIYKGNVVESKYQLFNHIIASIFDRVSNETVISMGRKISSHPRKLIINIMSVPPNTIRPDRKRAEGGRYNNDDITTLIKACVEINNNIPSVLPTTIDTALEASLTTLDMMVHEMIRGTPVSSSKNKITTTNNKQPNNLQTRIASKYGRIRFNLMGKRTGFCGRGTITCDSSIRVDELGIPLSIARNIQIPITVCDRNREELLVYFNNKREYPGCTKVLKKRTGIEHYIGSVRPDFVLENGDIIMRDLIDGDVVIFNRQPTMLSEAMTCHTIKISKEGSTIRMNISACALYNADFDGDAMNLLFATSTIAINEIRTISNIGATYISKATGSPLLGCLQDSIISISLMTHNDIIINKASAMEMFRNTPLKFTKQEYTGRELISMLLPSINYKNVSNFYNESYAPYVKYNQDEVIVDIKRGNIHSGVLDSTSLGEKVKNSIFHVIHNEYGPTKALNLIFDIQQVGSVFLENKGFSILIEHANVKNSSLEKIHNKTNFLLMESFRITDRLINGQIIPPLGSTVLNFYEQLQIEALRLADDFVEPVINGIDTTTNSLYLMVQSCKKGNIRNFQSITSALGSILINGKRIQKNFGHARILPYHTRYDMDPISNGFIPDSYIRGISPYSFILSTFEARISTVNKGLSTSVSGMHGRIGVNNLESLIINNSRQCVKHHNIIQFIYGGNGIDTRKLENVEVPTVIISDSVFEEKYHSNINMFDKIFRNEKVQILLDNEFNQIKADRYKYREIIENVSSVYNDVKMEGKILLPVNVKRIIDDIVYDFKDIKKTNIDPVKTIHFIKDFCESLHYIYFNEIQERKKSHIPNLIRNSMLFINILVRSYLNTKFINENFITQKMLELITEKIKFNIQKSLIDYGTSVGVLAAQSLAEPLTQYTIDSHHRVGVGGGGGLPEVSKTIRYSEIMNAKTTYQLALASMTLYIKEEYETDLIKVTEIATNIEKIHLYSFLSNLQIFFEEYGKPIHPDYKHEIQMIRSYEQHNSNIKTPSDITKWVIRLELNKIKMIIKNMDLETILFTLNNSFKHIHIVNTTENEDALIIRCYIRNGIFKKGHVITQKDVENLKNDIINLIIRGINEVENANVQKSQRYYTTPEGSIDKKTIYIIKTKGSNLKDIFANSNISESKSYSNSITEIEEIYGIEAARYMLRSELESVVTGRNQAHYSIIADEMCYTGTYTSMSKTGLDKREPDNILLKAAYSHAAGELRSGALDSKSSDVYGVSTPLALGQIPNIGTTYNRIAVDYNFIKNNTKSIDDILDDL